VTAARIIENEDIPPPDYFDAAPRTPRRALGVLADTNAESALLGACLLSDDAIVAAQAEGVTSDCFVGDGLNGSIWSALEDVGHNPVDVANRMAQQGFGSTDELGPRLVALQTGGWEIKGAARYARILVDCKRNRYVNAQLDRCQRGEFANWRSIVGDLIAEADGWAVDANDAYFVDPHADVADNPMPTVGARSDGTVALFYRGQLNSVIGESESCKSWIAQWACVEQIQLCEHTFYIDYEKDYAEVRNRLYLMGATPEEVAEYFHYERVEDPFTVSKLARFRAQCDLFVPAVCVIDGVNNALMLEGLKPNDPDAIGKLYAGAARTAQKVNAAVVLIDHLKKDRDATEPGAGGSQHKRSGITGASYKMRLTKKMSPAQSGRGFLKVDKDALGQARAACPDAESFGDVVLHVNDGSVRVEISPPSLAPVTMSAEGVPRRTGYMDKVSRLVEGRGLAGTSIESARDELKCSRDYVRDALKCLVAEGFVTVEGEASNKQKYFHVRPFRDVSPRSYYESED
jgi:hypothetical protein